MKRRLFCGSILALLLVCLLPLWAAADTGPKPSITVTPEGLLPDPALPDGNDRALVEA